MDELKKIEQQQKRYHQLVKYQKALSKMFVKTIGYCNSDEDDSNCSWSYEDIDKCIHYVGLKEVDIKLDKMNEEIRRMHKEILEEIINFEYTCPCCFRNVIYE